MRKPKTSNPTPLVKQERIVASSTPLPPRESKSLDRNVNIFSTNRRHNVLIELLGYFLHCHFLQLQWLYFSLCHIRYVTTEMEDFEYAISWKRTVVFRVQWDYNLVQNIFSFSMYFLGIPGDKKVRSFGYVVLSF